MVHHRPHGLAALPRRPGYLYVRRQKSRDRGGVEPSLSHNVQTPLIIRRPRPASRQNLKKSGLYSRQSRGACVLFLEFRGGLAAGLSASMNGVLLLPGTAKHKGSAAHNGASRRRTAPRSQPAAATCKLLGRCVCWLRCPPSLHCRTASGLTGNVRPLRPQVRAALHRLATTVSTPPDLPPNMSVNRRRHGRAARPCGRHSPSSAARPGCPAASPRLPLR